MSEGALVVTGAANGIGQAYPQRLARDGFAGPVIETEGLALAAGACSIPRKIEPEDIVGVVYFLCSKDSGFATGKTIAIDGGQLRN